jgi:hypothetical protein
MGYKKGYTDIIVLSGGAKSGAASCRETARINSILAEAKVFWKYYPMVK